ncbi:hypothetical protein [Capnocytophaga sp.]|uniref:hypothetical protein n=1 Tax=Capnocytophaga sp. TaxID=44737 RepID=UPI0026DA85BF|nr:hypothetical protein [Capnocytophaga sp.]MDO5104991.1 hypothetical protein [Capnocytophaga sp.]
MKKNIIFLVFGLILLQSCTTYQIPVQSFKEQFQNIDSASLKTVQVRMPLGNVADFLVNPVDSIICIDKNNRKIMLEKTPSIEIRFTEKDGNKTIFYFDGIYLQNGNVVGNQSRFINAPKSISLDEVKRIEIQDGRKKFRYVK